MSNVLRKPGCMVIINIIDTSRFSYKGTLGMTCCHLWHSVTCSNYRYLHLILHQIIKLMTLVYKSLDLSRKKKYLRTWSNPQPSQLQSMLNQLSYQTLKSKVMGSKVCSMYIYKCFWFLQVWLIHAQGWHSVGAFSYMLYLCLMHHIMKTLLVLMPRCVVHRSSSLKYIPACHYDEVGGVLDYAQGKEIVSQAF